MAIKVNAPIGHHSTASSQSSCRERLFSGLPKRQKATGKTKLHCCFHRVISSCRWLHNLACAILALPTVRFLLYDLQKGLNLALFQPGLLRRYTAVIQFLLLSLFTALRQLRCPLVQFFAHIQSLVKEIIWFLALNKVFQHTGFIRKPIGYFRESIVLSKTDIQLDRRRVNQDSVTVFTVRKPVSGNDTNNAVHRITFIVF